MQQKCTQLLEDVQMQMQRWRAEVTLLCRDSGVYQSCKDIVLVRNCEREAGTPGQAGHSPANANWGKLICCKSDVGNLEFLGNINDRIGLILEYHGKYGDAMQLCLDSLAAKSQCFGTEHESSASTFLNIASSYFGMRKYQEALDKYQKALEIYQIVLVTSTQEQPIPHLGWLCFLNPFEFSMQP